MLHCGILGWDHPVPSTDGEIAMLRTDEGGQAADETPHAKWDKSLPPAQTDKAPPPANATKDGEVPAPKPATSPGTGFGSFES